jgi:hypothetical protein
MNLFRVTFDAENLAKSLMVPTDVAIKEFKDGRVISRFSEHWCAKLYRFQKNTSSDEKGYDGYIEVGELGTKYIAIRSLTNQGIRFQLSIYQGGGRVCTQENLIDSLSNVDYELIVDCMDFPVVRFLPVDAKILLNLANQRLPKKDDKFSFALNPSGLKPRMFYERCFKKQVDELQFVDKHFKDLV